MVDGAPGYYNRVCASLSNMELTIPHLLILFVCEDSRSCLSALGSPIFSIETEKQFVY